MHQQWSPDVIFSCILFGSLGLKIFLRESQEERQRKNTKRNQVEETHYKNIYEIHQFEIYLIYRVPKQNSCLPITFPTNFL